MSNYSLLYESYSGVIDFFFFSSRRRHTRYWRDWSSDVCSSDLALIYNSVFHSNTGNPLEAVDTKVINSTFALNGGHVKLSESAYTYEDENTHVTTKYTSELHNSLIWKDNKGTGTQYEISRSEER